MRKKDFVAVAQALKVCRDSTCPIDPKGLADHSAAHDSLAVAVASVLARQSGTFNRVRFLHECGVNDVTQKSVDTVFIVA